MILEEHIEIRIGNHGKRFKDLGYSNIKQGNKIWVKIADLHPNSCEIVKCSCDDCGIEFTRTYQLIRKYEYHRCYKCTKLENGKVHIGERNHKWNSNKPDWILYKNRVLNFTERTYSKYKNEINPYNYPRTLCGVNGGYQLDHIISIKQGFDEKLIPYFIGSKENLQMLTWEENSKKWYKNIMDN